MKRIIKLTKGVGSGETDIAAFDAALYDAGICNYNLIRLSSVIPPGTKIEIGKAESRADEFGHKLYLVYAKQIEHKAGKDAWAGIGWTLVEGGDGKGLFTEHEGQSEAEVSDLIHKTLASMVDYREDKYGPVGEVTAGITCDGKPACAFVAAVYASEGW